MIRLEADWRRVGWTWLIRACAPAPRSALAPLTAALLFSGSAARADVTTPANDPLGTVVNQGCGSVAPGCALSIEGGTSAGSNLFHRFQSFDTRSNGTNAPITGVTFQNGNGAANVIVGVLSPTHISVPINLLNQASLFWLSPAGITISGNGSFSNVTNLTLSTATGLRLTGISGATQVFDVVETTSALGLDGDPEIGPTGLVTSTSTLSQLNPALTNNGDLVLQGGLLTVDQSLLLDAQGGTVQIQGGTINGPGVLTIPGSSVWSGGTITGLEAFNIPFDAALTLAGNNKQLGDTIFNNSGSIVWTSGNLVQVGNSVINNSGSIDLQADVNIDSASPTNTFTTQLNNLPEALLLKSGGAGGANLGGSGTVNINNEGFIQVSSGTLTSASGSFTQAGSINVGPGATFARPQGFTNLENSFLSGSGTIAVGNTATLTNQGIIVPGGTGNAGTLSIQGNVSLSSTSQLLMDVGGSDSIGGSVGSDQLSISGSASLAGSLFAFPANAVVIPATTVNLITASSITGGFDPGTSSIPPGFTGAIVNAGTIYRLSASFINCAGVCWDGGGGANTNWATAANWTGDLLPTSTDLVYLDLVDGADVTLTDSRSVAALFSSANNTLSILNGGSLELASSTLASQLDGGLSIVSGGSLRSNANLTIQGAYSQSGGSLNSDGALTIRPAGSPVQISGASVTGRGLTILGLGNAQQPNGVTVSGSQLKAGVDGLSITSSGGGMQLGGTLQSDATVLLQSSQGVRLSSGTQISASGSGDPLVVVTGAGPFLNEAGSAAFSISGGGRWLIYADTPAGTSLGGLPLSFKQYGKSFGASVPILGSGNGLLYGLSPAISASLVNVSKVYDGTSAALLSAANLQLSGVVDNDVVVVSATGNYISGGTSPILNPLPKDVGTDKLVAANASLASATSSLEQGSVPVYGYQLNSSGLSSNSGAITPLDVALSGLTALERSYDASINAPLSGTASVATLAGDAVSLVGTPIGSFADPNVGTGKPVSISGVSLSGPDAANYSLVLPSQLTAAITPLGLSAGFTAADKVYDGNTTAVITSRSLSGVISGDAVSLSGGSASFADRNVAAAKPVSASGFSLSGADAGNYSLSGGVAEAFASITPLSISAGFTAADKVYDGNTTAVITSRSLSGVISGDAVSLSGGSASFADRNVAAAKPVSASGFSLSGADAGNYRLANSSAESLAAIRIRPLSTWQSGNGGNWSDAANWDALPDGNNVSAVLIPAGSGPVVFDAAVGPTVLQSLTNQGSLSLEAPGLALGQLFNSGALNLTTDLNLAGLGGQTSFSQTGGTLGGPASLSILSGSGSWSGGLWSGSGQVRLTPGSSLTIEATGSQWGGRTLVVQAASDTAPAATLTINGSSTASAGSSAIVNRGLTRLNDASLSREGGSLQVDNRGALISNGSSRLDVALVNSGGSVQVASGSLQLNGGGSDSNGSVQVTDGAELVWGGGDHSLFGGTGFSGSGSGRFRLAGGTLTAATGVPLLFDAPLVVEAGTLSGSGSLSVNGGYRQSGGQLSGFSSVTLNQPQGLLQISGTGRNTASIVTAPGGAITLTAPAGSIEVSRTGLDARGSGPGGSILFEASASILIDNAALLTSGNQTGGTITIGNALNPPVLTTIRGSNLIADPPATGGVINIYGQTIVIDGSTLNLYGESGGALVAGNNQTSQLTIDPETRIIAGPGATLSCNPNRNCEQARIERIDPTPAPAPPPSPKPIERALADPAAAVALNQAVSQTPLSNDSQTSSQVQQPPAPLLAAISGSGRNPLDVSLDQASSFSPDLFAQPTTRRGVATGAAGRPGDPLTIQPDGSGVPSTPLSDRPVSSLSSTETRANFSSGTAQAQQDTARRLGLSEAEQDPPPSIEDLQKAMQQITEWMRSKQQGAPGQERRCGGEGQPKCPS